MHVLIIKYACVHSFQQTHLKYSSYYTVTVVIEVLAVSVCTALMLGKLNLRFYTLWSSLGLQWGNIYRNRITLSNYVYILLYTLLMASCSGEYRLSLTFCGTLTHGLHVCNKNSYFVLVVTMNLEKNIQLTVFTQ